MRQELRDPQTVLGGFVPSIEGDMAVLDWSTASAGLCTSDTLTSCVPVGWETAACGLFVNHRCPHRLLFELRCRVPLTISGLVSAVCVGCVCSAWAAAVAAVLPQLHINILRAAAVQAAGVPQGLEKPVW